MKVRVVKGGFWHEGKIGEVFNVELTGQTPVIARVDDPGSIYHENGFFAGDFEMVTETTASTDTKLVQHEGITYEVPRWAKFLTRDKTDKPVFYWEFSPKWHNDDMGWYHSDVNVGRNGRVVPYVAPKPAGNFNVAI